MKINFGGHELTLHPSGILLWPDEQILIVSDLHLEKGSHFARRGYFLPPYDSSETMQRIFHVVDAVKPRQLIILGDCFHDHKGYTRLSLRDRALFDKLSSYHSIWIKGNHDKEFVPPGFRAFDVYEHKGLVFRHEALSGAQFEISGHFHPKAEVSHKGSNISRRCFVEDGHKLILPAFGAYTGGLSIKHPAIESLLNTSFKAYLLGENKIYKFEDR